MKGSSGNCVGRLSSGWRGPAPPRLSRAPLPRQSGAEAFRNSRGHGRPTVVPWSVPAFLLRIPGGAPPLRRGPRWPPAHPVCAARGRAPSPRPWSTSSCSGVCVWEHSRSSTGPGLSGQVPTSPKAGGNPPRRCRAGRRKLTEALRWAPPQPKEFPKASARKRPEGSRREVRRQESRSGPGVTTSWKEAPTQKPEESNEEKHTASDQTK